MQTVVSLQALPSPGLTSQPVNRRRGRHPGHFARESDREWNHSRQHANCVAGPNPHLTMSSQHSSAFGKLKPAELQSQSSAEESTGSQPAASTDLIAPCRHISVSIGGATVNVWWIQVQWCPPLQRVSFWQTLSPGGTTAFAPAIGCNYVRLMV